MQTTPPPESRRRALKRLAAVGLAFSLISLTGCEQIYRQYGEAQEKLGDSRAAKGEYPEAVLAYEAALSGRPESAETHLKIGLIYDEQLDDPISAAHHFQRYLDLAPEGRRRKDVEGFIKEDHLKLLTRMGNGAILPQREAVRLKNDNLELRKTIQTLRADIEASTRERAAMLKAMGKTEAKNFGGKQVKKPLVPGVRVHVVGRGETLGSISRKYYGREANWKRIQDANFNPMEGAAKLQIGMELMIP